ncbi:MAG: hypothetical protein GX957_04575 [Clostridiaceae bacterium]|nr:hypothetical protein [Clostridiaceae bacterium]
MWIFKRKSTEKTLIQGTEDTGISFEASFLRHHNITRLSIDERWTKLFVNIKMSPEIEQAEKDMNELIKKEAMLKQEQENLEPQKRKLMKEIINLTQEAFENDSKKAKERLKQCKKEIEKINIRINDILEDIEDLDEKLRQANLKLLQDSITYIFKTLKSNRDRAQDIKNELNELKQRELLLTQELESISFDWTKYAVDLTELLGADEVKKLEDKFGLEELKDEIDNTPTNEDD